MKKTIIDLSEIFLTPLLSSSDSFIKVVGSGTGLGKTYSCVLSLQKSGRLNAEKTMQLMMENTSQVDSGNPKQ